MEDRLDYDVLEQRLHGGDEDTRLEAVRQILTVPIFDGSQVPRFLKILKEHLNDKSVAVRYYGKKAFARLKKMTQIRDIGIILPHEFEEAISDEPAEAPTYVYGSREYWYYELNSIDYKIRIKAIIELTKEPDDQAYQRLAAHADSEKHDHVLATLAKYLAYFKRSDAFFKIKAFLEHSDSRVRANAIEGFQILGDPRAVPLVMPYLADRDNRIRANAARLLVMFHPEEVVKSIREMLASSDEWTRDSALYLLSKVEIPQVESLLLEALRDSSEEIVEKAVLGLGYNGSTPLAEEALTRIQEGTDPDGTGNRAFSEKVRHAAAGALELLKRRMDSRRSHQPR